MYPLLRALGRIFRLPGIDILTEHSKAVVQARRQMKTSSRVCIISMCNVTGMGNSIITICAVCNAVLPFLSHYSGGLHTDDG